MLAKALVELNSADAALVLGVEEILESCEGTLALGEGTEASPLSVEFPTTSSCGSGTISFTNEQGSLFVEAGASEPDGEPEGESSVFARRMSELSTSANLVGQPVKLVSLTAPLF